MGGGASEEFLAESEVGEDTFVRCVRSGYAANVEAVVTPAPDPIPFDDAPAALVHDTENTPTIATLVDWANSALDREVTAADTLKNVLVRCSFRRGHRDRGDRCARRPRGRHEAVGSISRARVGGTAHRGGLHGQSVPGQGLCRPERAVEQRAPVPGRSAGGGRHPLDHQRRQSPASIIVDPVAGRDFVPTGTIEAAEVREGDLSPDGKGVLTAAKGIEIGHIFQLGQKYTNAFEVDVLGENGKPVRLTMGSYGIGVSRLVAVIAEQCHDDKGLRWPREVTRSTSTW